jgi:catechol 2,3-dioxygenase-like lactoylglutathione lyase family enzyme
MGMLRFDHLGVVVEDLDDVAEFFLSLGFDDGGGGTVDGDDVDKINGIEGVRAEFRFVRTPDGTGSLELIKYHAPAARHGPEPQPANRPGYRHFCIEVEDLNGIVDRLRDQGFGLVGETRDYGNSYRLCYVRGPEGLIVELAENISAGRA